MSTYHDRKAAQFLRNPQNREALEKLLGGKIVPKEAESAQDGLPVVACLVPCRDHPHPRMQEAFNNIQKASRATCNMYLGSRMVSTSVVHWSRNMALADLIKTGAPWTHVLFIDDDIVPSEDALIKLLSHKKEIIGAVCTTRQDPPRPNIKYFDEQSGVFRQMLSWPDNALLEVGGIGTGMILITREALHKVADAFWRCAYERDFYQMPEEAALKLQEERLAYFDRSANAYWFRFLPSVEGYEMGEDMSFCYVAKKYCGIPIFCDTSIQPEHMGHYGYSLKDYLPYRDEEIAKAKAQGLYHENAELKPEGFKLDYEPDPVGA